MEWEKEIVTIKSVTVFDNPLRGMHSVEKKRCRIAKDLLEYNKTQG